MKATRLSYGFRSADGRTLYAVNQNGTRLRVHHDGVPVRRLSKAEKKAEKKARMRARRAS